MKCKRILVALTIFLCLSCASPSQKLTQAEESWLAQRKDPIVVATEHHYPPYIFQNQDGEPDGISIVYMRRIAEQMGFRVQFAQPDTLSGVLEKAKTGQYDVVTSLMKTDDRSEYLLFTEPYSNIPAVFITRSQATGHPQELTLDQLTGKTLAVPQDYSIHRYIEKHYPEIEITLVKDDLDGLRKVSFGQVEIFACDLGTASFLIEREGLNNLRFAGSTGFSYQLALASRIDDPVFNRILAKGIASISEDERRDITRRWVALKAPPLLQPWVYWVAGIAISLLLLIFIWNRALRRLVRARTSELQAEIIERRKAEDALKKAHHQLEERVAERTAELNTKNEAMHQEVVERRITQEKLTIAREIATCTVHNIANVCNGLTIGLHKLEETVDNIRAEATLKLARLLIDNQEDLATFFSENPKGAKIPEFLELLGNELQQNKAEIIHEIHQFSHKVQLIKQATTGQQAFAKSESGQCRFPDVVEDSLNIQLSTRLGETVEVHRDYHYKGEVDLSKGEIMHILLNLFKNAVEAMQDNAEDQRHLYVTLKADEQHITLTIKDTGTGINPEHLDKMFEYGFTTKSDGHGFGLRYCAQTVRGMGGSIHVASDGLDQGATFTLKLPNKAQPE